MRIFHWFNFISIYLYIIYTMFNEKTCRSPHILESQLYKSGHVEGETPCNADPACSLSEQSIGNKQVNKIIYPFREHTK